MMNKDLPDIFNAALSAVDPYRAVIKAFRVENKALMVGGGVYRLDAFDRVLVVGAGKASASMARAVEEVLGEKIDQGILVVKYGHAEKLTTIEQIEASHPKLPTVWKLESPKLRRRKLYGYRT